MQDPSGQPHEEILSTTSQTVWNVQGEVLMPSKEFEALVLPTLHIELRPFETSTKRFKRIKRWIYDHLSK